MNVEGEVMKKILAILLFFILSVSIGACQVEKTYDDLYLEYLTHIENNIENYQSSIEYFNHLSSEVIKSVVLVEKVINASYGSSTGSGIIIKSDEDYYYILTNNHVIYAEETDTATYTISDYRGNEYNATLVENSEDYDLAILRFNKGELLLTPIVLSFENPMVGEKLAVIGYPSYQINAITLGNVIDYAPIDVESASYEIINVLFDVLISDVPVKSGSSGSVVVDSEYQLVGIIYAGNFIDQSDTSEYSFSIPVEKVFEFFQLKNFSLEVEE